MPLNPPPTIELGLGLLVQPLQRSDQSRAAELTFSLNVAGTPSPSVAQSAVNAFYTAFTAVYASSIDTDVTILPPSIKLGDGSTTPYEAVSTNTVINGGDAALKMPPNVALLIRKNSGLGGRKNHGRTYVPFILQQAGVNENGTLAAGIVSGFDAINATFLGDLTTAGIPMVISHKVFNVPLAPHYVTHVATGPLVTTYKTEALIATQRRRLGR